MKIRHLPALILLSSTLGASAQTMKPGLWEITTQMQSGGKDMGAAMAAMQKQMASMPPEQRKMMDEMMAKQGVKMGTSPGGGMAVKVCMTQEMVDRHEVAPARDGCTHAMSPRVGNTMKFAYKCTQPPSSGQGEVSFTSPEAYTSKMSATGSGSGTERSMEMQSSGRWMGGDCGDIKPIQVPGK
ncbi:MAG: DUF3617 domain-containing protein [Candidatus Saccharibacteria bacterium]|nr:DUF3617 domain-containing protein [Rhodoferax sp.]